MGIRNQEQKESFHQGGPLFLFYGFFLLVCLFPPSPSFTCNGIDKIIPSKIYFIFSYKAPHLQPSDSPFHYLR